MPEGNANVEIAQHLREHDEHEAPAGPSRRRIELIEILEAVLLGFVALMTALSGYQAARWDGRSAEGYAAASKERVLSEQASLQSGQLALYDTTAFNSWLSAYVAGDKKTAAFFARRFTPNYRAAFYAWIKLDPLNDPKAPAGPRYMPQYKDPLAAQAASESSVATKEFDAGVTSRNRAEDYVRVTVILAAVLFLIAIGQRFKVHGVRVAVTAIAGVFLAYVLILIATYPRA